MRKGGAYYNEIEPFAAEWLRNLIKAGEIAPGDVDERDIRDVTPAELMGYGQCHFFAGIGGWSRALRLAGWPDDRPVWTGSCPCQSFSAAGRGLGFADERHLWPSWFHLIRECRPATIFGEQVASKLALSWLDLVSDYLEGEGYAVGSADLCAASVGAFHIRQRLWIVAVDNALRGRYREQEGAIFSRGIGSQLPSVPGHVEESEYRGQPWRNTDRTRAGTVMPPSNPAVPLADPHRPGCFGRPQDAGQETGCGTGEPGDCEVDLLGHAGDPGLPPCEPKDLRGTGRGEEGGAVEQSGGASGELADGHKCPDLGGLPRPEFGAVPAKDGGVRPVANTTVIRSGAGLCDPGPGEKRGNESPDHGGNFWHPCEWLPCRDGKYRPTKPGLQPLAHGVSGRVGKLRAAGNSIVPEVGAEFIKASNNHFT